MRKFEQLHAEEGFDLALEAMRVMLDAKCNTLEQLIAKRDCTPRELWREICADRGFDEVEPWPGFPAGPKRDFLEKLPGADRPLHPAWQALLDQWQARYPHWIGRQ
jgi:hypothetical protein